MSYRELRNFKEIMATLGYPRLISIENFKVPHFELVADILVWLCHRYDKNMEVLDDIRTEHDRVAFLKSVAEQLLVKARVKLNLKNLYASNGFAVRELLKIATLLHDAHRNAAADAEDDNEATLAADIGPGHKFADIKLTRSLAADITKFGSSLHELLASHSEAKDWAAKALGKNFDADSLKRQLNEMNSQVTEQTENLKQMLANLSSDEQSMQQVLLYSHKRSAHLRARRGAHTPCSVGAHLRARTATTCHSLTPLLGCATAALCVRVLCHHSASTRSAPSWTATRSASRR